ncbi:spermidine hydroxycinnamoyl transferase-like [Vicia villosa]|uniref:spermidine hydroxycinnamoyl transferase-like n=1 Tax=Vicia villosa TaxID=3911 RepID=UPI00273C8705|nr:spermidine hydroxycinnamoyl transferase-like [Vicia villosa]
MHQNQCERNIKSTMSSSITLKGCYTVKPIEPTWSGCLSLTECDQVGIITHVPLIYFYRPPQNWLTSPTKIATILKHSLSRVLMHFYVLAGRLRSKENCHFDLECNAKGVEFIEAESSSTLYDLGNFSPSSNNYYRYLFPHVDYTLPIHELPLLLIQLTKFKCGDISISVLFSHAVVDGQGLSHFLNEWAQLARGEPLKRVPCLDRTMLHDKKPCNSVNEWMFNEPPLLLGNSDGKVEESKKKTRVGKIKLNKAQVEKLRKIANESWNKHSNDRGFSRYETIAGHMWRSACKARGHKNEQPTMLGVTVDWRSRVKPSLPKEYFGNAAYDIMATSLAGDLMSKPSGYASSKIKETIEKVNDEYVRLMSEYFKKLDDWTNFQNLHEIVSGNIVPFYQNPNLGVVSWLTLSLHRLDFGWGNELYMEPGIHDMLEGESFILPSSHDDGSLMIFICLQEVYMDAFKRHFYEDLELENLSKL